MFTRPLHAVPAVTSTTHIIITMGLLAMVGGMFSELQRAADGTASASPFYYVSMDNIDRCTDGTMLMDMERDR